MSESINPYAPPAATIASLPQNPAGMWTILVSAWDIFRARFAAIAAIVILVWTPCELLDSYMDFFVFDSDDFKASFNFSRLLYYSVGVIATAGVIHVVLGHCSGRRVTVGQALSAGARAWPRLAWTVFLTDACLAFSFILLVVPFFYQLPRFLLVESVVVCEGLSGGAAIERCHALAGGRYWKLFGFTLLAIGIVGGGAVLTWTLAEYFSLPEHWLLNAAVNLMTDFLAAFETVLVFCLYRALSQPSGRAEQT